MIVLLVVRKIMRIKFIKKLRLFERGVALLMVLAALALISGLVVEFAYNSHVTYNLALNEEEKLQAYYLAESGLNFSKMVLSYDNEAKRLAEQANKKFGKTFKLQPLYEMLPINSALLRGMAGMMQFPPPEEEGLPEEAEKWQGMIPKVPSPPSSSETQASLVSGAEAQAKDFFDFKGDFLAEIHEEDSKINVNSFYNLKPTQKEYTYLKSILYHLLVREEFKGLFEDRYRDAAQLVQNIADYIDRDDSINDAEGQDRGREGVSQDGNVKMKNAKLLSVEELRLVPGMTDAIYQKMKSRITVYGKDEKVYLCRADDAVLEAFILAYSEANSETEALKDDNQEVIDKAKDAILNSCPNVKNARLELNKILGIEESSSTPSEEASSAKAPTSASNSSGLAGFFALAKDQAKVFSILSVGNIGETEVRIRTILDTSEGSSRRWKELYWRVE